VKVTKPTSAEADISSIYKIDTEDCNEIVTDIEPAASANAKEVVHNVVQNYQAVSTKSTNIQMRLADTFTTSQIFVF